MQWPPQAFEGGEPSLEVLLICFASVLSSFSRGKKEYAPPPCLLCDTLGLADSRPS